MLWRAHVHAGPLESLLSSRKDELTGSRVVGRVFDRKIPGLASEVRGLTHCQFPRSLYFPGWIIGHHEYNRGRAWMKWFVRTQKQHRHRC